MITTKNIIAIYKLANANEIKHGLTWYVNANADCKRIASKLELPIHIVIGVVSALSPNNKWERNIVNAEELCVAFINGQDMDSIKVSTYHKMKQKAWHIMETMPNHEETISILNGQKIVSVSNGNIDIEPHGTGDVLLGNFKFDAVDKLIKLVHHLHTLLPRLPEITPVEIHKMCLSSTR